jgi:hypothetical protein
MALMKTLLVSGREPSPAELRAIITQGSTSLDEVSAADLATYVSRLGLGVDRIVFWAAAGDQEVRSLALNYATAAGDERRHTIVYVSPDGSEPALDAMTRDEMILWPRDADKLRAIFTSPRAARK